MLLHDGSIMITRLADRHASADWAGMNSNVISEGWGGAHVMRTVYAADRDDARQTHKDNYADEPLLAVHQ